MDNTQQNQNSGQERSVVNQVQIVQTAQTSSVNQQTTQAPIPNPQVVVSVNMGNVNTNADQPRQNQARQPSTNAPIVVVDLDESSSSHLQAQLQNPHTHPTNMNQPSQQVEISILNSLKPQKPESIQANQAINDKIGQQSNVNISHPVQNINNNSNQIIQQNNQILIPQNQQQHQQHHNVSQTLTIKRTTVEINNSNMSLNLTINTSQIQVRQEQNQHNVQCIQENKHIQIQPSHGMQAQLVPDGGIQVVDRLQQQTPQFQQSMNTLQVPPPQLQLQLQEQPLLSQQSMNNQNNLPVVNSQLNQHHISIQVPNQMPNQIPSSEIVNVNINVIVNANQTQVIPLSNTNYQMEAQPIQNQQPVHQQVIINIEDQVQSNMQIVQQNHNFQTKNVVQIQNVSHQIQQSNVQHININKDNVQIVINNQNQANPQIQVNINVSMEQQKQNIPQIINPQISQQNIDLTINTNNNQQVQPGTQQPQSQQQPQQQPLQQQQQALPLPHKQQQSAQQQQQQQQLHPQQPQQQQAQMNVVIPQSTNQQPEPNIQPKQINNVNDNHEQPIQQLQQQITCELTDINQIRKALLEYLPPHIREVAETLPDQQMRQMYLEIRAEEMRISNSAPNNTTVEVQKPVQQIIPPVIVEQPKKQVKRKESPKKNSVTKKPSPQTNRERHEQSKQIHQNHQPKQTHIIQSNKNGQEKRVRRQKKRVVTTVVQQVQYYDDDDGDNGPSKYVILDNGEIKRKKPGNKGQMQEVLNQLCTLVRSLDLSAFSNAVSGSGSGNS